MMDGLFPFIMVVAWVTLWYVVLRILGLRLNGDQVRSMEQRMHDLMDHYQILQQVPFEQIASRGAGN